MPFYAPYHSSIKNGTGSVTVNANGSISITPTSGQQVVIVQAGADWALKVQNTYTATDSGTGALLLQQTADLVGKVKDTVNIDHRASGDGIYVVHSGGMPAAGGSAGGNAGLNVLIPKYKSSHAVGYDATATDDALWTVAGTLNDHKGMVGVVVDHQVNNTGYAISSRYWGTQANLFIRTDPTDVSANIVAGGGRSIDVQHYGTGAPFAILHAETATPTTTTITLNNSIADQSTRYAMVVGKTNDANPTFRIRYDGLLTWGPGGATAADTYFQRINPGEIQFGQSGSPGVFRITQSASGNDALRMIIAGEANFMFITQTSGLMKWGPGGGTAPDTTLQRIATNGGLQFSSTNANASWQLTNAAPATANYGLLSVGSGAWDGVTAGFFAGSASGTQLAVNAAAAFGGNLADLQIGGVTKVILASGAVKLGKETAWTISITDSTTNNTAGGALTIQAAASAGSAAGGALILNGGTGAAGNTAGRGGAVTVTTGGTTAFGGGNSASGDLTLATGNATGDSAGNASGAITIQTGTPSPGSTGTTTAGISGAITIQTRTGGLATTGTGAASGALTLQTMAGGLANAAAGIGGISGTLIVRTGNGGAATHASGGNGGAASNLQLIAGNGGAATNAVSNGGAGASIVATTGNGGASGNALSGSFVLNFGTPTGTGAQGLLQFGTANSFTASDLGGAAIGTPANLPTGYTGTTKKFLRLYDNAGNEYLAVVYSKA